MDYMLLVNCFIVGLTISLTPGPIFVLTFNHSALNGFFKGFACALGAALVDSFYFTLSLLGILTLLESSRSIILLMNGISGMVLILLGVNTIKDIARHLEKSLPNNESFFAITSKSILLTILNPLIAVFFMFISIKILPENVSTLPLNQVIMGSLMVGGGSLTVLSAVALIGSFLRSAIKRSNLIILEYGTGFIFIGAGFYFLGSFVIKLIK